MHIVHLEDDSPLREILKVGLQAVLPQATMQQFSDSDDALDYIQKNCEQVDLFIFDVRVPGSMNGVELARKVREIGCKGVIAITSAYRAPDRAILTELNCEWYPKPWHIVDLIDKLRLLNRRTS